MTDEELLHHLKTCCFGKSKYTSGKNLICKFGIRESDLRKRVNRLRRRAIPIASSCEGYFAMQKHSKIRNAPFSRPNGGNRK